MAVGTKQLKVEDANVGQAHKADQILKQGFPQSDPQTEFVVVQSATKTVDDPAFRATVDDVVRSVKGDPATKNFKSPLAPGNADQISKDRRTVDRHVGHEGHVTTRRRRRSTRSRHASPSAPRAIRASSSARPARPARARRSTRCSATS